MTKDIDREESTYKKAGVDIEAGYEVVRRIKDHARRTAIPGVLGGIGSFGGLFALDREKYKEPVLVAGTDGVGTKLKIAFMMDKHDTVGIDAVAYSVNDIICQGAKPLFFLDYIAMAKVEPAKVEEIVKGVCAGCRLAGCALLGGETAEMPGMYAPGEYDLVGFGVGVVEKTAIIDGSAAGEGDRLLAVSSSGLHSNGYSLVRHVLFEKAGLKVDAYVPELGSTLGEALLVPTAIYADLVGKLTSQVAVHGIANITGGGLYENVPRAMGADLQAVVRRGSWIEPPIFSFIQKLGNISDDEMFHTFNMGVGLVVIVPPAEAGRAAEVIKAAGFGAWDIGEVRKAAAGEAGGLIIV
ncbi:MAG TPA: phosphoribosylformylglycinamidine cyclo-ligase [Firmicutes bacterium]|nr:phosphoribosylformylglycinamidine cyclo-ligase [Bacillota bacterium]